MSESMLTAAFIILSGGLQDAYTYLCRGKVFANAQTGNIVLFSAYLFDGDWAHSRRYLVPVLSFMLGIFVAECIHRHFKHMERVHWRQLILLAEIVLLHKALTYFGVIGLFAVGAGLGALLTGAFAERGIWVSCALLAVSFLIMFIREEEAK